MEFTVRDAVRGRGEGFAVAAGHVRAGRADLREEAVFGDDTPAFHVEAVAAQLVEDAVRKGDVGGIGRAGAVGATVGEADALETDVGAVFKGDEGDSQPAERQAGSDPILRKQDKDTLLRGFERVFAATSISSTRL